jgi:hypothetical protein
LFIALPLPVRTCFCALNLRVVRALLFDCPYEVRQQAIGGCVEARIFFGDREAGEDVGFEINVGRCAGDFGHRLRAQYLFWLHACLDAVFGAAGAADQFEGPSIALRVSDGLRCQFADAFALDPIQADRSIHQNCDQSCGFCCGVPAVDVVGGIGFGDAEFLRFLQRFVETQALFHLAKDDVGGGVQDSVKTLQMDGGEVFEQGEDRDAIHHGGFEEEALAFRCGQVAEFAVRVDDGAFVGGDGVGSVADGGADVVDGGLSGLDVEGGGFEEDIGLGVL